LHIAQQMPLPLTISCSSKSRLVLTFLVLPFWYLLTRVVPDLFQKSSKTVVCVGWQNGHLATETLMSLHLLLGSDGWWRKYESSGWFSLVGIRLLSFFSALIPLFGWQNGRLVQKLWCQ